MIFDDTRTDDEKRADELIGELRLLHAKGKLPAENPFFATVGSMIWRTREDKGISRAHLAKVTGISQNSLAKYEKAGEQDGQYPPLPKMALLCKELELDPREVLHRTFTLDEVVSGRIAPDFFAFEDFLRTLDVDKSELDMARKAIETEVREAQHHRDRCQKLETEKLALERQVKKLTSELLKQNGPDQNDPSRPGLSKNNAEAVDAASTNPTKGKTDEVA